MTLKETKIYFETMFATGWTTTPIHFMGQEVDMHGVDQWINVSYKPRAKLSTGFTSSSMSGAIYVVCWAKDDFDVMDLSDKVIAFYESTIDPKLVKSHGYNIIDHGYEESGKSFIVVSFNIETYKCDIGIQPPSPAPCADSIGTLTAQAWMLPNHLTNICKICKG